MPSLPELETYKRRFGEFLGRPITKVEPLDFRVVRATREALDELLVGHTLTSIDRYGKWLIFSTGASDQLLIHLGLKGQFTINENPKYGSLAITFEDSDRLVLSDERHLGKVYVRDFAGLKAEKKLGPDLLQTDEAYFTDYLRRRRKGVRDVLMDQHVVAGIGGKYADEILWQAKLHPNVHLDSLSPDDLKRLYHLAREIHETAVNLDGNPERFPADWLIPHRKTDKLCPLGHGPLTERSLGGSDTLYCPVCQPVPKPA
ncbi:MAG: DNA-formamidopyrimidine glycosylase [Candidatus Saccharibacteria bacterium]|jgi:formamidopyrimidine-DNA glycosylase|nr:DNA-formamidopyrimidine glycosylase [Candidatus Saccharibacteria bacterium]